MKPTTFLKATLHTTVTSYRALPRRLLEASGAAAWSLLLWLATVASIVTTPFMAAAAVWLEREKIDPKVNEGLRGLWRTSYPARLLRWWNKKPIYVKRYQHKDLFSDTTNFLGLDKDGVIWIVRNDGTRLNAAHYTEEGCDRQVRNGLWFMLPPETENPWRYSIRCLLRLLCCRWNGSRVWEWGVLVLLLAFVEWLLLGSGWVK